MDSDRTLVSAPSRTRWLVVALVAGAILVVSVIPIPGSVPDDGGGIPTSVRFHFLGYAALAAALALALAPPVRRSNSELEAIGGPFLGASGYGAVMELLQLGLSYRTFSPLDMAINASGALLATIVSFIVLARRRSE